MRHRRPIQLSCVALLAAMASGLLSRTPEEAIELLGTLREPRAAHTATTLRNGQVLIVGGMSTGGGSLASSEILDPDKGTTRETGRLGASRSGHSATLLPDGRVLVAGGYNGDYLRSVEVFDPSSNGFLPAAPLNEARSGHTATLLPDGRVLLVGGVGTGWTFLNSAELYDPRVGLSMAVGLMSLARESHTATLLADGRVLVVGGHRARRPNQEVHALAEVWDPSTGRFQAAGALNVARHKHDAIRLADGRVLVIGGADGSDRVHYPTTEVFEPASGSFTNGPPMLHGRYKIAGTSVLLPDGDALVTSGARAAERLDAATWTFSEVQGGYPAAFRFAASAALSNGMVVITGGYSDSNRNTDGIWLFRQAASQ